jgi:D-alanyl-D-alanine carboxypeptidase (penicillin-binding protein 5/6)
MFFVPKLRVDQYFSICLLVVGCMFLPLQVAMRGSNAPFTPQSSTSNPPQSFATSDQPASTLLVPVLDASGSAAPVFTASGIYVMDRQSGSILFQKNPQEQKYPASTAKMMTALVARKFYALDQELTVREEAFATGSSAHFKLGERLTVKTLLAALLIPSGNDAAFVLANNHPGGYDGFVAAMNARAHELHLDNTMFKNPSGLDSDSQESTARDLAILANEVMKDPLLRDIVGTKQVTLTDVTGKLTHRVITTQELLGVVDGVVGIKTGTTQFAGENLVTEVDRDGHQVIFVVLGSKDRFSETRQLIDWVFGRYSWQRFEFPRT